MRLQELHANLIIIMVGNNYHGCLTLNNNENSKYLKKYIYIDGNEELE